MLRFLRPPTKASSRTQIKIEGIRDGVLQLPSRQYRSILEVSSLNFELKSEAEQDALIDTYQSFLNSLPCPLQILIRVREVDLDDYLRSFQERAAVETDQQISQQIAAYQEFVRSLVATNRILARRFYVVVPYHGTPTTDHQQIREQLGLTTDIISKGLARLGIRTTHLSSLEVLDLFYSFYDPPLSKTQPLTLQTMQLLKEAYA